MTDEPSRNPDDYKVPQEVLDRLAHNKQIRDEQNAWKKPLKSLTKDFGKPTHGGQKRNAFDAKQDKVVRLVPPPSVPSQLIDFASGVPDLRDDDLIESLIPKRGKTSIIGKFKAGKSVITLDMATRAALGMDYFGLYTANVRVAYIMTEGTYKMNLNRIIGWCRVNKVDPKDLAAHFVAIKAKYALDADPTPCIADIRKHMDVPPNWVVIDTLAENMTGDENTVQDMTAFGDGMHRIETTFECHVSVVHHKGKSGNGSRGSTYLPGLVENEIDISADSKGRVAIKTSAARDSAGGAIGKGKIIGHVLGTGPIHGKTVDTGVFVHVTDKSEEKPTSDETGPESIVAAMTKKNTNLSEGTYVNRFMTREQIRDALRDHLDLDTSNQQHITRVGNIMKYLSKEANKPDGIVECEDLTIKTHLQRFKLRD